MRTGLLPPWNAGRHVDHPASPRPRRPPGPVVSARSERDAAYFTLLRAREEHEDLLRYGEYLEREVRRLEAFVEDTRRLAEPLARRVRRAIDATARPMAEAVGRRRTVVEDELRRSDDRIAAAAAFVEECEAEVASLGGR